MFDRLRLVVLLLIVVLPLQGLAASARALCGQGHGAGGIAIAHGRTMAPVPPEGHRHATDAAPHDHAVATSRHAVADHVSTSGDAQLGSASSEDGADRCAHCAACTVGTAIVGPAARLTLLPPGRADFPSARVTPLPRPFDGPDRPPRTV